MADMRRELDRHLAAAPDAGTDVEALADLLLDAARHIADAYDVALAVAASDWLAAHDAALIAAAEARGAAEERERIAKAIEAERYGFKAMPFNQGMTNAARIARTAPATDRTEAGEQR